jgi:proteic killer suppression protein
MARACHAPAGTASPQRGPCRDLIEFPLETVITFGNIPSQVIENFTCKETSRIFYGEYSRKFPSDIQPRALMKLRQLHRSISIDQLRQPPSNRLEALSGNLKGFWSIRVNQQWRIVFRWENANAADVQITDYH